MDELFFFAYRRLRSLIGSMQESTKAAQMSENLEAAMQAYRGLKDKYSDLQNEMSRLQKRYDKLKGK